MTNLSKNLLWDITATVLSVLFFQFFIENASFNPYINWEMVIFDSIAGIISYSIVLILLRNKQKFIGIPMLVYSVVLGSIIWSVLHSLYGIYFDWRYLSNIRPESFNERSLETLTMTPLIFVPLFSINAFIFLGLLRILKKIVSTTRSAVLP
jgi:hypothetical protein